MRTVWGILFIGVGLLVIGANQGWWNQLSFELLWQYWPVILILIGVSILLKSYTWKWLVMLLLALVIVAVLIDAVSVKPVLPWNKPVVGSDLVFTSFDRALTEGIKTAELSLKTGFVELELSGKSDSLIKGEYGNGFRGFDLDYATTGDNADISIKTDQKSNGSFPRWNNRKLDFKLASSVIWDLNFDTGASKMVIDTRELQVQNIAIQTGATDLLVWIGEGIQNNATVKVSAGASNVQIKYPLGLGVDLKISSGLASRELRDFEKIDNNHYRSTGYESESKKTSLNLEAGLSSIQVERY